MFRNKVESKCQTKIPKKIGEIGFKAFNILIQEDNSTT